MPSLPTATAFATSLSLWPPSGLSPTTYLVQVGLSTPGHAPSSLQPSLPPRAPPHLPHSAPCKSFPNPPQTSPPPPQVTLAAPPPPTQIWFFGGARATVRDSASAWPALLVPLLSHAPQAHAPLVIPVSRLGAVRLLCLASSFLPAWKLLRPLASGLPSHCCILRAEGFQCTPAHWWARSCSQCQCHPA